MCVVLLFTEMEHALVLSAFPTSYMIQQQIFNECYYMPHPGLDIRGNLMHKTKSLPSWSLCSSKHSVVSIFSYPWIHLWNSILGSYIVFHDIDRL